MPRRATRRRRRATRRGRTGNFPRGPLWTLTKRNDGPWGPPYERRESTARLLAGDPQASGRLPLAGSGRLRRLGLGRRRRSAGKLHVGHLEPRDGLLDLAELLA